MVKDTGISNRIRAWSTPYRLLIDSDNLIDILQSNNFFIRQWFLLGMVEMPCQHRAECGINKRRLTATRHTGDTDKHSKRNFQSNIFQVISCSAGQSKPFTIPLSTLIRHGDRKFPVQIFGSSGVGFQHLSGRTFKNHITTKSPCAGTHIHNIISGTHHIFIMLHHYYRITYVTQLF